MSVLKNVKIVNYVYFEGCWYNSNPTRSEVEDKCLPLLRRVRVRFSAVVPKIMPLGKKEAKVDHNLHISLNRKSTGNYRNFAKVATGACYLNLSNVLSAQKVLATPLRVRTDNDFVFITA